MKLGKIISELRDKYKLDNYSPSLIYAEWNRVKNQVLAQKLKQERYLPEWVYNTFCVELEEGLSHECGCIPHGCLVFKTLYPIPETLSLRAADSRRIRTLDGRIIGLTTEEAIMSEITDYIKGKRLRATQKNGKILIWNVPAGITLKAIQIEGVFQDITQWEGIQYCDDSGGTEGEPSGCVDMYDVDIKIPAEINNIIFNQVAATLPGMLQREQADVQEGNPEVGI